MGTLMLDPNLAVGQWRWLTTQEESAMRESVRLD
jgi:16S rRNA U516 pseudouridylate synthase RsuA-like enzyme